MAYFSKEARILSFSDDLSEKSQIEYGLNRRIVPLTTFDEMVREITQAIEITGKVYLIITEHMGKIFKANISDIVEIFEKYIEDGIAEVYEIGLDGISDSFKRFGTIYDFVQYIQQLDRDDYIYQRENSERAEDREEGRVLREISTDLQSVKNKLEETEQELEDLKVEYSKIKKENTTLNTHIEHKYTIKINNLEEEVDKLKSEIRTLSKIIVTKDETVRQYEQDIHKTRTENVDLKLKLEGLEIYREDLIAEKNSLKNTINRLNVEKKALYEEINNILGSRVDGEDFQRLTEKLEKTKDDLLKLQEQYEKSEREIKSKEFRIADLVKEIDELRRGDKEVTEYGRSYILDNVKFNSVDILYIKVIDDLPYTQKLLGMLYERIKQNYNPDARTHLCVIRNDEGLDDMIYSNYDLYGKLDDVSKYSERFRLYPSRKMFTGKEVFDKNVQFMMVLDFVRSKDYLIDTDGKLKYLTMVKDSKAIGKYELKGSPISLTNDSVLEVIFSNEIHKTVMEANKRALLSRRIENCIFKMKY